MYVATLIADNLDQEQADVQLADDWLRFEAGCQPGHWHRLEPGKAVEIRFEGDLARARTVLEAVPFLSSGGAVDVIVRPLAAREKRLLVADMDSTMITVECIDELADYAGIKDRIAAVTEAAMRGELDFAAALDARVALLEGLDEGAIDRCLAERVRLTPGAETLVKTMRARGAYTVLVSGGFTRFAEPVGRMLGFDRVIANRLEIADGKLTGRVEKPIVDASTKRATLIEERARLGLADADTLAIGDGANDLEMIRLAGLGVAYHAKPVVAAAAGARIDHCDLTALLHAQGIPSAEWVRT